MVTGNAAQPTLNIKPQLTTIQQGDSDNVTFSISGNGTTSVPLDKNIQLHFSVKSSRVGARDFTVIYQNKQVPLGANGLYTVSPDLSANQAAIKGDPNFPATGATGSNSATVTIVTHGTSPETLTITMPPKSGYTGISHETKKGWLPTPAKDLPGVPEPMLVGLQPAVITVNAPGAAPQVAQASVSLVQAMAAFGGSNADLHFGGVLSQNNIEPLSAAPILTASHIH
jgi:hypothetical protein